MNKPCGEDSMLTCVGILFKLILCKVSLLVGFTKGDQTTSAITFKTIYMAWIRLANCMIQFRILFIVMLCCHTNRISIKRMVNFNHDHYFMTTAMRKRNFLSKQFIPIP